MSKGFREDLTGKRFGRLTVIEFVPNEKSNSFWRCQCDCGNYALVCGTDLKSNHTKSCGCMNVKHRLTNTKLYSVWHGMKSRCYNKNTKSYKNYGGRGIIVCAEWKNDFNAFYEWSIANGYQENLTIDRIDVDGNYEPSNCTWIDDKAQHHNRRDSIIIEFNHKKMCIAEVATLLGISRACLYERYHKGDRGEHLLRPSRKKK